mgnify:CR=1 FL=1
MDASKFFIDRPIFAAVLSILIFVAGLIALPQLPIPVSSFVSLPIIEIRRMASGPLPMSMAPLTGAPILPFSMR